MLVSPDVLDFSRATTYLAEGKFEEGFRLYESRLRAFPDVYPLDRMAPRWDGKATDKKLVVWQEFGAGDAIHFVRYLPKVMALCPNVVLAVKPELVDLFALNYPLLVVDTFPAGAELQCSLCSLGWLMKGFVPNGDAYLTVSRGRIAQWSEYQGRIGFVPKGSNPISPASVPDAFLQKSYGVSLKPIVTGARDWADTAGILKNLKLLIGVDTGVTHLAGALGVPTWILLKAKPEWRWCNKLYDSVRCMPFDSWSDAMEAVEKELFT